jgi:hypothetical protein
MRYAFKVRIKIYKNGGISNYDIYNKFQILLKNKVDRFVGYTVQNFCTYSSGMVLSGFFEIDNDILVDEITINRYLSEGNDLFKVTAIDLFLVN